MSEPTLVEGVGIPNEDAEQIIRPEIVTMYVLSDASDEGATAEERLKNTLDLAGGDTMVVWMSDGFFYVRTPEGILRAPYDLGEFEPVDVCNHCGR